MSLETHMAENARLTVDRANIIGNAIVNDGSFVGSPMWLEEHHVEREEFETFIEYAVRLAGMYDWRAQNMGVPPMVECSAVVSKAVANKKGVNLTVAVQPSSLAAFQTYMDEPVTLQVYPDQMPLDIDGVDLVPVDVETGEVM